MIECVDLFCLMEKLLRFRNIYQIVQYKYDEN